MKIELSAIEARIIGALLEKQCTTPDQYPLSLHGVVTACNQKSNREPVMTLGERAVQDTLDRLAQKHLVTLLSGFGNRVLKYEHRFCNSEFGQLRFSAAELALITTLLLRGAQTPGELRTRAARMCDFASVDEVEIALNALMLREDGPFVVRLPREPGKRECRYQHLFSGDIEITPDDSVPELSAAPQGALETRVEKLEAEVAALTQRLDALLAAQTDNQVEEV
ncbi:MAG: hypothetical protein XXXJIFNMEKO3_01055 [Candidatus Erwinia impunctatus]